MNWKNLKNGKCPKCSGWLTDANSEHVQCTTKDCGFTITAKRLAELLKVMASPSKYKSDDDRRAEWNNYGTTPNDHETE